MMTKKVNYSKLQFVGQNSMTVNAWKQAQSVGTVSKQRQAQKQTVASSRWNYWSHT